MINKILIFILTLVLLIPTSYADKTRAELKRLDLDQFVLAHGMRIEFVLEKQKAPISGFIMPASDFALFKTEFEFMEREINSIIENMTHICEQEIKANNKRYADSLKELADENVALHNKHNAVEAALKKEIKLQKIQTRNYTIAGTLIGATIAGVTVFLLR